MSNLEKLFFKIDEQVEKIKKNEEVTYFEALNEYLKLEKDEDYFSIVDEFSKEDIKKAYQFLLLKALKELNNPSYDITPEVIAMYVAHIVECIFENKKVNIADFASGSGNFLLHLENTANKTLTSVDVDNIYANLQQSIFNLLEQNVTIINQDVLKPLNIELQDVVISDTPFGYYADEDNSLNYKLCSEDGYSINSLLFIEQASNYLAEDGVGVLVVPQKILELDKKIKEFLEKDINLNAVIELPQEMFKNSSQRKVIILITKKEQDILPRQVFLATLPGYQNKKQYANFIAEFKDWLNSK